MNRMRGLVVAAGVLGLACSVQAGIAYVNTSTGGSLGNQIQLSRVGVDRGGTTYSYYYSDLILPTVSAARMDTPLLVTYGTTHQDRNLFLRDSYLTTGVMNLPQGNGTLFDSTTQWMQVTFDKPVVNGPGSDLVLFRLDWPDIMIYGATPMRISVAPNQTAETSAIRELSSGSGLGLVPDYTYPIGTYTDPTLFGTTATSAGGYMNDPQWIAQTFDLSNLGVAQGSSVSSLYLQQRNSNSAGLMLIAGLPAVPEPSIVAFGLGASVLLMVRRRAGRGAAK